MWILEKSVLDRGATKEFLLHPWRVSSNPRETEITVGSLLLLLFSINARAAITSETIMFLESNISFAKAHMADAQI